MKPSSAAKPFSRAKARNCFLLNQFATPGLGSLIGGRIFSGIGQLLLSLAGFALVMIWFVLILKKEMSIADFGNPLPAESGGGAYGVAGVAVFAAAWCWSLITSLSLLAKAKAGEARSVGAPPIHPDVPPKI